MKMEKIKLDEFYNIKGLSNLSYSKNGKNYAFVVSNINKDEDTYESYIYVGKGDNKYFKLTSFGKEGSYQFLDDDNIIFSGNRKPNKEEFGTKFYKININGGEAEEFLKLPINVVHVTALKNGDYLCLAYNNPLFENKKILEDNKLVDEYKKYMKENNDYEEFSSIPFYMNGMGFIKGMKMSLYYYHTKDNKLDELTSIKHSVSSYEVNEEEDKVFVSINDDDKIISFHHDDMYAISLNDYKMEKLISYKDISIEIFFSYKNGFYFYGSHNETGINTDPDIYYYDYDKKAYEKIIDYGYSPYNSIGTDVRIGGGRFGKVDKDGSLYFITTRFDSAYLYKLKDKKIEKVIDIEGSVETFDVYNGNIMIIGMYDTYPQELYEFKNNKLNKLSDFNDYLKDYYVAKPKKVEFKSFEDIIHGFVLEPIDYDKNKTYPVILDVHGGPKTIYSDVFYHEMQYWTSEGYFVIYCNPTGSDGRGRKFADIRGKYGTIDYQDIMNFVDYVLDLYPQMDKSHLYETGGSYGGFMSNWIIGHTDRFKACATQRSISNWISFYGTSDIGFSFAVDQSGGDIFGDVEKMWKHSPLKYAKNVKTPTLFIHSNEDYRCPMEQGMQMYTAIVSNGIEAKFVYFKGQNHELSRSGKPSHRIKRLKEITEWFKNHK